MTPKTTTTAPENHAAREDTGYHSIRYHCPTCNFAFDIGEASSQPTNSSRNQSSYVPDARVPLSA